MGAPQAHDVSALPHLLTNPLPLPLAFFFSCHRPAVPLQLPRPGGSDPLRGRHLRDRSLPLHCLRLPCHLACALRRRLVRAQLRGVHHAVGLPYIRALPLRERLLPGGTCPLPTDTRLRTAHTLCGRVMRDYARPLPAALGVSRDRVAPMSGGYLRDVPRAMPRPLPAGCAGALHGDGRLRHPLGRVLH